MASERTKRWPGLLAAGAIGTGVGAVFGGGRLSRVYDWMTEWNIDAPLPDVYRVMREGEAGRQRYFRERAGASAITPVEVTE